MTSSVLENEEVKNIIEGTHDLDILKTVLKNSIDKEDIISKWTFFLFYDNLQLLEGAISKKFIKDPVYCLEEWTKELEKYKEYDNKNVVDYRDFNQIEFVFKHTKEQKNHYESKLFKFLYDFVNKIYSVLNNNYHQRIFESLPQIDKDFYHSAKKTLDKYSKK